MGDLGLFGVVWSFGSGSVCFVVGVFFFRDQIVRAFGGFDFWCKNCRGLWFLSAA